MGQNSSNAEHNQTLNTILRYYLDKYELKKGSSNTSLRLGANSVTKTSFYKMMTRDEGALKKHCTRKAWASLIDAFAERFNIDEDEDILKELSNMVFEKLQQKAYQKSVENAVGSASANNQVIKAFSYDNVIPIIDIKTTQKAMFNVQTRNVLHSITYEAYKEWRDKQPKEVKEAHNLIFTPASIAYDPRESGSYKYINTDDGQEIISVNSHNMPEWRKTELKEPKLPIVFDRLMRHLFPEDQCRKYVYFWLYNMLDDRSSIHLLLHGHRGIGKSSLLYVAEHLVGQSNYYYVPKEFFDNNFDYELRHKRLLYFDEHTIHSKKNEAQFKQYHEPKMAYHGKGMPITGIETNFASHVISNNTEETNHLVYEARRYSVPLLTHKPIKEALGEEFLDELHRLKTDKDFLANVGWWILQNCNYAEFEKHAPYKSSLFFDIVNKALYPWQKWVMETIKSRASEAYFLEDFSEELTDKYRKIGRVHIENFLATHKDEEGDTLGYVKQIDKRRCIVPTEKYMPQAQTDNFNNEDF